MDYKRSQRFGKTTCIIKGRGKMEFEAENSEQKKKRLSEIQRINKNGLQKASKVWENNLYY